MNYRVYDKKEKKWIREDVYISPNGDLYISKKSLFGTEKLSLGSDTRYTYHRWIELYDKNRKRIFEGDICTIEIESEYGIVVNIGVITYIPEHASYYLLDHKNLKYYPLVEFNSEKHIEVVGNCFDNEGLISYEEEVEYDGYKEEAEYDAVKRQNTV